MAKKPADDKTGSDKKKDKDPASDLPAGNVKLIGIAGLVKGEHFSIEFGQEVIVGRSRDCDISLTRVPAALEIGDEQELEKHFRTVSRKHMRLHYVSQKEVVIEDLSSNGLFIDGKRVDGSITVKNIVNRAHELRLGTTETFALDFWKLVKKSDIKMVKVKTKKSENESDEESEEGEEGDENK